MARDLKAALRQLMEELEGEDLSDALEQRLQALEQRQEAGGTVTVAQILGALETASDDELEALHGSVLDRLAREVEQRREDAPPPPGPPAPPPEPPAPPEPLATRPGRRQGQAYNWAVDDDGNVVPLEVARIWNEPDETETVALPEPDITEEVTT